jgi:hypothetical protein
MDRTPDSVKVTSRIWICIKAMLIRNTAGNGVFIGRWTVPPKDDMNGCHQYTCLSHPYFFLLDLGSVFLRLSSANVYPETELTRTHTYPRVSEMWYFFNRKDIKEKISG